MPWTSMSKQAELLPLPNLFQFLIGDQNIEFYYILIPVILKFKRFHKNVVNAV